MMATYFFHFIRYICLLVLGCAVLPLSAQFLSLTEVLRRVKVHHPYREVFRASAQARREAVAGADAWMPPMLGLGQFMTPYNISLWQRKGNSTGMGSVMLTLEQQIPNKGERQAKKAYLSSMTQTEQVEEKVYLNQLFKEVKTAYYAYVIAQKKESVLANDTLRLHVMINTIQERYGKLLETASTYYAVLAQLGSLKEQQIRLKGLMREKRMFLNTLMGRSLTENWQPDTALLWEHYQVQDYQDTTFFYEKKSDIKVLNTKQQTLSWAVRMEREKLKPSFGVRWNNMLGFGGQPFMYTAEVMMRMPFISWSRSEYKAKIKSLQMEQAALQARKKMLFTNYSAQMHSAYDALQTQHERRKMYENTILPPLKKKYALTQLSYEQNTADIQQVYDAWGALNAAQMAYWDIIDAIYGWQVRLDDIMERSEETISAP